MAGTLSFKSAPDFEAPTDGDHNNQYEVTVQASDGSLTDSQAITVTVSDVNDNTPVIGSDGGGASASLSVAENHTAVTTVQASDADAGTTIAYSIVGGADASLFAIDGTTGALSFKAAPDFEAPADSDNDNQYDLTVQASDGALTDTQAIAVTVTNVNDNAPVVSASDKSAARSTSLAAASLFSVSDADNDSITAYRLWDATSDPLSGHFAVNGVAQSANQVINVTAAQLSQVTFVTGSHADSLSVQAFDGTFWSAWKDFYVNPLNHAPVVSASNQSVAKHTSIDASSLFSVSDADNDSVTAYRFWDGTSDPLSGHFAVGGVAQATNQVINVSAAQLSQTTFETGAFGDNLQVQVFDGTSWSAWAAFQLTTINHPPAASASDQVVAKHVSLDAASLFSVSDPDNDSITAYRFWDGTPNPLSGHFAINGVAQGVNQIIDVSAAQLSQTTFDTGTLADDLWVQVYDGTAWSAWTEFHLTHVNQAPVTSASDQSVAKNASLDVSSLFSVSDPDNDSITAYHFWDGSSDPASGHFAINGVAQGVNQIIDVSPAQLAQTTFETGMHADSLWAQAYDGAAWSAWTEFTLTPANQPPVVSASSQSAAKDASLDVASLFSVSDTDNDTITDYHFWDGTGDPLSGHFAINGVAQGVNQIIDVSAAQLSQVTFETGSHADGLWIQVYDGTAWSSWAAFQLTPANQAPVVSASNQNVARDATLDASSLFSVSDADNDSITAYHFWDATNDPLSGHFANNGVAQGADQIITVSAAQLAQITFETGTHADTLSVQAYDGTAWSAWSNFQVTPANQAPVVSASDQTVAANSSLSASSLFSVSDADNDTIAAYHLWDGTNDPLSGYFAVNGVAQSANQVINVSPSQLAQTTFETGTNADTLSVQAYDGTAWSAWHDFHLSV